MTGKPADNPVDNPVDKLWITDVCPVEKPVHRRCKSAERFS
jgi:hypothetical protein